jgi:tyrosyl-tRNA synthetase
MTYRPKSDFLTAIIERGFLADCTDLQGLDEALMRGTVPAYIGYDATARSLHVGHLLNIMLLRWLQKTGHKPITLMGGGTTKVGDPSFRAEERPLLGPEQIAANIDGMQQVFAKYLGYGGGAGDAIMLDNAEWLDGLNYLEFLRDIGRHFSVNRMLSFESVKSRLDREQSLSFLEFNYMILQAYDFLELYRRHGCLLQMGGSDQWGNIVNGVDLTRRVADAQVFGLTTPLLTTSDGRKMGKSAGGAIWLNAEMLSPYEFWQFWRNTTDADVGRFLKLFTRASGRGMRPAGRAGGRRDQRGQGAAGERGHAPLPRRRGGGGGRGHGARGLRRGRHGRGSAARHAERRRGRRGRVGRAALRPRGAGEIGQGRAAADRRGRRAAQRRAAGRCRADDPRRGPGRAGQADRRAQAPRAGRAGRLSALIPARAGCAPGARPAGAARRQARPAASPAPRRR